MRKKKSDLIGLATEGIGLGIVGGAGLGAMGAMSNLPNMPAASGNVTGAVGSGMSLLGVGFMAKAGMAIPKLMNEELKKGKKKSKWW